MLCKRLRNWLICVVGAVILMPIQTIAADIILSIEAREDATCPLVYAWDGENYQFANDIYSVGKGENKEFIDYLNISNSVVPKDGVYSFEIREISGETSWTDVFKLIAIDHPADVRVGVDSSGNVHSYESLILPDSAVDGEGNDVLSTIAEQDNVTVNIFHDSTVVLDFSSVNISEGAKLVMDLNGFEGKVGGGFIPATPAVQIQTIEAGEWVTRHSFFPKVEWAEGIFDLKPYLTESKTVRLLGASCFGDKYHIIDQVGLDNTPDRISYYEVLDPQTAWLNGTVDVLYEITDSDDIYVNIVPDDVITVTFPYNQPVDEIRSFAIISEGYYTTIENTYYVDTWSDSGWVERYSSSWPNYDLSRDVDLSSYLPDTESEYKVRVRNSISPGPWGTMSANLDYIKLTVNGCISTSYTPSYAQQYSPALDILASVSSSDDVYWNAANQSALIKFDADLNQPPIAVCQDIAVQLDTIGNASITASNIDGGSSDPDGDSITLSASQTSFVCSDIGFNTVTLTVNDSQCIDTCQATVKVEDKAPPLAVTKNITVQLDSNGNASITADDIDSGSADNCGISSMTVSPSNFTCANVGANTVTLTVTDNNGNVGTATATVTVEDNTAPTAVAKDITVQLDADGNASIAADDINNGSDDNCGIASMTVSPSSFTCADIGANTVTLTVTDNSGNVSTATATVTVEDNTTPTAVAKDITVQLDADGNASITADDVNNGSDDNCGIASMTVSPSSFTCADIGANTVTLTVTDNSGNVSTATATVTVEDNTAPTAVAKDITVQLDADGNASITADDVNNGSDDNCGIASMTVSPSSFTCADVGTNTVTLTVTDNHGVDDKSAATVTVVDGDSDEDGVTNCNDNCSGTELGAVVDGDGCSIDQLCPCEGPQGIASLWKNHGKYVSCTAKSAESFVETGLITEAEKDVIVSDAAQSDCGDKK